MGRHKKNSNDTLDDSTHQKKRGRPKKKTNENMVDKDLENAKNNETEEEDLILRIPFFDDNTSSDKKKDIEDFMMSENMQTESIKIDMYKEKKNISIDDYKLLLKELKKKDEIIEKLKLNLDVKEAFVPNYKYKKHVDLVDMKLIDSKTGKKIVSKTDIACWWCCYNFDNTPCFIPDKYVNDNYYVFGCFCSYGCAMAYNLNMNDYKVSIRSGLLKDMYYKMFGTTKTGISPAKEILEKFGGPMKIEDFRNIENSKKKEYKVKIPSMIALAYECEEQEIINR